MSNQRNNEVASTGTDRPDNGSAEAETSRPALTKANLKALQESLAATSTANSSMANGNNHSQHTPMHAWFINRDDRLIYWMRGASR
ncbi:hypothetical protein Q7P37_008089 [Cladosporium fusiforme]